MTTTPGEPENPTPPPGGGGGQQPGYPQQSGYPPQGYPQQPGYGPPPPGYGYPPHGGAMPGAPFGVDPLTGTPYSDKSRTVAGVLQLLLGGFGAGRWYTGHTGIAVAQLLTCGGLGIWALVDGILMLIGKVTDSQGRPLHP